MPATDGAITVVAPLAAATAGGTLKNIRSGVMRNPPPTPNTPERKPTPPPIANSRSTLSGSSAMGR
jgi:hypothetical protein